MRLFSLLWIPLFYVFWSSLGSERPLGAGGVWAVLLGSVYAALFFFLGPIIDEPGAFGQARLVSAFVDVVGAPALAPFAAFALLLPFRVCGDWARFALLWLIPGALLGVAEWNADSDPIRLVLVPLLRTATCMGVSSCLSLIARRTPASIAAGLLALPAAPAAASASYWYFFCQQPLQGWMLLAASLFPQLLRLLFAALAQKPRAAR
jgi:hypothetical protein